MMRGFEVMLKEYNGMIGVLAPLKRLIGKINQFFLISRLSGVIGVM